MEGTHRRGEGGNINLSAAISARFPFHLLFAPFTQFSLKRILAFTQFTSFTHFSDTNGTNSSSINGGGGGGGNTSENNINLPLVYYFEVFFI